MRGPAGPHGSAAVIFSARAPRLRFYDTLDGARTLNFLEAASMILESTIKDGLYRYFRNFIIYTSFITTIYAG